MTKIRNIVSRAALSILAASLFAADIASSAVEFLPSPTREPKLFRQTVIADCDVTVRNQPTGLNFDICRFRFVRVGNSRLLELATIACWRFGTGGLYFLTTTATPDFNAILASTVSLIPGEGVNLDAISVGGPHYFTAGEQVVIWGATDPGAEGERKCTIFGKISRTD